MLGYGVTESNARIRVRGNSSSVMAQNPTSWLWTTRRASGGGQSNIALNKSAFDVTRIKNKLYFDMLKDIREYPASARSSRACSSRMNLRADTV